MAETKITVYGAPWCPDCKRAKQFLGEQRIPYHWVDIEHDEEARRYVEGVNSGKQIIPTIVFEDGSILVEPSNAELAQKVGIRTTAQRTFYDLVIVGAGPAGLAAALYAAREGLEVLAIEKAGVGGQAGTTERIDNYPGFVQGVGGGELADNFRDHAQRFGVEILTAQAVASIGATDNYRIVRTESGDEYCGRALLLATGARYRRLNVPGEEDFIGAGVHFCAACDGPFYKGQELLVVGGGNSGVEEGLFLTTFAPKITLVEITDRLRASKVLQDKLESHPEVQVHLNTSVQEFKGNQRLTSVVLKNVTTGETWEVRPGGVFVFVGLDPASEPVRDVVEVDRYGFVVTRENLETSIPGIFAAGDVRAGSTKQVASAVGEGATAALMIRQYLERS